MPIKECNKRCSGCAYTDGSEANKEPKNVITATLAVLGPFPFYCHENIDYKTLKSGPMSLDEFHERRMLLCTGWQEEVKSLAATGYYADNPEATKTYAQIALENIRTFLTSNDTEEKNSNLTQFKRIMTRLIEKRRRFNAKIFNENR